MDWSKKQKNKKTVILSKTKDLLRFLILCILNDKFVVKYPLRRRFEDRLRLVPLCPCILIILCSFLFLNSSHALYHNPNIERLERRIQINALNDTEIEAQLIDVLKNNTDQEQEIQFHYPLPLHAQTPHFFVDALATPFEIQNGDQRLNTLFDQATEHHDSRFLKLGSPIYGQLIQSIPIIIPPGQEIRLKLKWDMNSEFVNNFHFLEIFTDDEQETGLFEVIFSLATTQPIWHFFTNIKEESMTEKDDHQVVLLSQKKQHLPSENLKVFWSHLDNPTLQYLTDETIYYGHFESWDKTRNPKEIIFLIDSSGSMSDNVWNQTLKYINFLLEKLQNTNIKILLVDENVRPFKEEFQENTRSFLKDFMEHTESLRPVGKSNILEGLLSIKEDSWKTPKEERAIILITDQVIKIPENTDEISAPVITLYFNQDTEDQAGLISYLTGGFGQRLFRAGNSLLEADELWSKFQHWTHPKQNTQTKINPKETDLLPTQFTGKFGQESPLFIGRKFDSFATHYTPAADFLTRRWGSFRLAQILRNQIFESAEVDAILSILKRFGIQLPFINTLNNSEETKSILNALSQEALYTQIQKLENSEPNIAPNLKFHNSIPFSYDSTNYIWRSYDFDTKATTDNQLKIAPFSLAQRQLFLQFPELLATGFGIGEQTEFCTLFRCISVRYGHKENPELSDRAFLSDFDPQHWANPYILQLVKRGIFKPSLNGKIHPDRAIDRGEFLRMIYQLQTQDTQIAKNIMPPIFQDIDSSSPYFEATQHYAQTEVIKGYKDGTFRPFLELSRAEAIKIILSIKGATPILLKDSEPIFSDTIAWERPWVEEAYHQGIIKGFTDGTFRPRKHLTRASAVKLIVENFLNQNN